MHNLALMFILKYFFEIIIFYTLGSSNVVACSKPSICSKGQQVSFSRGYADLIVPWIVLVLPEFNCKR